MYSLVRPSGPSGGYHAVGPPRPPTGGPLAPLRGLGFGIKLGPVVGSGATADTFMFNKKYVVKLFKEPNPKVLAVLPKFAKKEYLSSYADNKNIKNEIKIQKLASKLGIAPKILTYEYRHGLGKYIIMEYINGTVLRKIKNKKKFEESINACFDTLLKNGIIHNDLSHDNILIEKGTNKIYIIDYGSSVLAV
jgi:tRNA A-37 threonylcarbamoyl transferase component Bud32